MYNNPVEITSDYLRLFDTKSIESITKIATAQQVNLFINASSDTKKYNDKLTLMAMATTKNDTFTRGAAVSIIDKNASMEELSVKMYNASMMAIEALNNKIKLIKI